VERRRSRWGTIAAGGVVIAGGIAVALVETARLPKWSIWVVVAATIGLVAAIRALTRR
jgi:hypothetical protein